MHQELRRHGPGIMSTIFPEAFLLPMMFTARDTNF